jgi:hypothetical protein
MQAGQRTMPPAPFSPFFSSSQIGVSNLENQLQSAPL